MDSLHSLDSASGFEPLGRGIEALRARLSEFNNIFNILFKNRCKHRILTIEIEKRDIKKDMFKEVGKENIKHDFGEEIAIEINENKLKELSD